MEQQSRLKIYSLDELLFFIHGDGIQKNKFPLGGKNSLFVDCYSSQTEMVDGAQMVVCAYHRRLLPDVLRATYGCCSYTETPKITMPYRAEYLVGRSKTVLYIQKAKRPVMGRPQGLDYDDARSLYCEMEKMFLKNRDI